MRRAQKLWNDSISSSLGVKYMILNKRSTFGELRFADAQIPNNFKLTV
jgi:hypothetical protein